MRTLGLARILFAAGLGLVPASASPDSGPAAQRAVDTTATGDLLLAPPTSRAEVLSRKQAAKALALEPYRPSRTERILNRIESTPLFAAQPRGLYPILGGLLPGAGWLQTGVGYRQHFGDAGGWLDVAGRYSIDNFAQAEGTLQVPDLALGRLSTAARFFWLDAPNLAHYGVGNDTPERRAGFALKPTVLGVKGSLHPRPHLSVGGRFTYERFRSGSLKNGGDSVEELFPDDELAGLGAEIDYLHSDLFVEFDWRQSPGYNRRGGRYRLAWNNYVQQQGSRYNFQRWELHFVQYAPLLNDHMVLALRAAFEWTALRDGSTIPFYLLPNLGGGQELRSFVDYRFRDRHRLMLNAEYRWRVCELIDMALFVDSGKVAARTGGLDLNDLHVSYGGGIRLHTPRFTALRVDVAHGAEGTRLIFTFGPPFQIRIGEW